jgi:hypothetical protein
MWRFFARRTASARRPAGIAYNCNAPWKGYEVQLGVRVIKFFKDDYKNVSTDTSLKCEGRDSLHEVDPNQYWLECKGRTCNLTAQAANFAI